mmetsp:Transcript_12038/g.50404  ORF Transcript_12038/g.50404 Transcript_12038/m.50404 type:complete len:217 (+) Transcript_12038:499-1149(+)
MSSTLLAPAQKTATGVLASSVRSAETSMDVSPPRCTPPTPPVTNTDTPARAASSAVAETVVAPVSRRAMTAGTSRRETLRARAPSSASRRRSASSSPTRGTPSMMATVAGVAPRARTIASTSRAICRFWGYGMPCDTMVLSRATTAPPEASASATDGWSTTAPAATEAPPSHGIVSHCFGDEASDEEGTRWPARAATRRDARTSISPRETRATGGV